jgi:hypothetical protein
VGLLQEKGRSQEPEEEWKVISSLLAMQISSVRECSLSLSLSLSLSDIFYVVLISCTSSGFSFCFRQLGGVRLCMCC